MSPIDRRPSLQRNVMLTLLAASLLAPTLAMALPTSPRRWVDNLDERCFQFLGTPAPLNDPVTLTFLDPVLVAMGLDPGTVVMQSPQQLCMPVKKNGVAPPADTVPYISFLDWECYGITGPSLDLTFNLTQLNPVAASLLGSGVKVTVGAPQQLCVPVFKNATAPTADEQKLVSFVDVECFAVTSSQSIAGTPITLTHLNPLFATHAPENLTFSSPGPSQICVPVAKNGDIPLRRHHPVRRVLRHPLLPDAPGRHRPQPHSQPPRPHPPRPALLPEARHPDGRPLENALRAGREERGSAAGGAGGAKTRIGPPASPEAGGCRSKG